MQTRVQYLAKEEEKFMRKIEKTRDDAMRLQGIKQGKINDLQNKIKAEQKAQDALNSRLEQAKEVREKKQALKLKKAYEEMVQFEEERKKERARKAELQKERQQKAQKE